MIKLLLVMGIGYLLGRLHIQQYEKDNKKLRAELIVVKTKRQQEREKYEKNLRGKL